MASNLKRPVSTPITVAANPFLAARPTDRFMIQSRVLYQLVQAWQSPGEGTAFP